MPDHDPELLAAVGPRVRKSPFFDCTVEAGLASVSAYNHMWLPMSYGDSDVEYERLTTGVSMWDVAAQRHIEVAGDDADALVQLATVVDTTSVAPGFATYAPLVDHDGILVNDPILVHLRDGTWRFSIADADVRLWLHAIARERDLSCDVRELDTATLAIQGPRAPDVLDRLGLASVTSLDDFEHRACRVGDIDVIDVIASRSGWSNQSGFELFLDDPTHAGCLWKLVAAAGSEVGIGPGAPHPVERLENVLISYGTDTRYDSNPYEIGLGDLVVLDGPDFVGRDALARIADHGAERQLLGAVLDGERLGTLPHPVPFECDGTVFGELRAASWSPRFSANIGLALVDASLQPGAVGSVDPPAGSRSARLVSLPYDETDVTGADR